MKKVDFFDWVIQKNQIKYPIYKKKSFEHLLLHKSSWKVKFDLIVKKTNNEKCCKFYASLKMYIL